MTDFSREAFLVLSLLPLPDAFAEAASRLRRTIDADGDPAAAPG